MCRTLAGYKKRQVPVASWLNAVHEAAREAHLTSGSLCMPDWLKHTTFAGRRISPEVSTASVGDLQDCIWWGVQVSYTRMSVVVLVQITR